MLPGERLDALDEAARLRIIQKADAFRFGTDSVLLADFAAARPGERVADLGAGSGILSILMASRQEQSTYDALEIRPDMADMAARSVALNGLQDRIAVHNIDLREGAKRIGWGRHSLAVCNPPYGKAGAALVSAREGERIARHEGDLTIEAVARAAAEMLKNGGRLALIYPAPRLFELMCALRRSRLEPKRVRAIHARPGKAPKLFLLDAVKGGGSQLHWLAPLILANEDGAPSDEWRRIYRVAP